MMADANGAAKLQRELTTAQIAEMYGVSPRMLAYAGKVRRYGSPELIRAVQNGSLTLLPAAKLADLAWDEQREALQGGKAAIKAAVSSMSAGQWNIDRALKEIRKAMARIEDRWPEAELGFLGPLLKQMGHDILAEHRRRNGLPDLEEEGDSDE